MKFINHIRPFDDSIKVPSFIYMKDDHDNLVYKSMTIYKFNINKCLINTLKELGHNTMTISIQYFNGNFIYPDKNYSFHIMDLEKYKDNFPCTLLSYSNEERECYPNVKLPKTFNNILEMSIFVNGKDIYEIINNLQTYGTLFEMEIGFD